MKERRVEGWKRSVAFSRPDPSCFSCFQGPKQHMYLFCHFFLILLCNYLSYKPHRKAAEPPRCREWPRRALVRFRLSRRRVNVSLLSLSPFPSFLFFISNDILYLSDVFLESFINIYCDICAALAMFSPSSLQHIRSPPPPLLSLSTF